MYNGIFQVLTMRELKNFIYNKFIKPSFLITSLTLKDIFKLHPRIYSNEIHLKKGIHWLVHAQKITNDGGVSSSYSLIFGWKFSYPETSGYIIPTLFDYYNISRNTYYLEICKDIADWECLMQLKNGGFQGKAINKQKKAIIFNTGQILLGLVRVYKELNNQQYLDCAIKAGDFLVKNQEKDGNWKKHCFNNISHTYNVRTAWSLLELFLITKNIKYKESAIRNLNYAFHQINENYWFLNNSFKKKRFPFLHTISYAIRGFLESGIILENDTFKNVALNSSMKLLNFYEKFKFLPARFNHKWESTDFYSCLTGDAQLSIIWLKLFQIYKEKRLLINAMKLNNYLKLKQIINIRFKDVDGAIKGSDPIWGKYNMYNFPNWATKFFCDTLMLENKILSDLNITDVKRI